MRWQALVLLFFLMGLNTAYAGVGSRLIRQWENVKQYVKQLYESRGARLVVVEAQGQAESEAYNRFFTSTLNQGPLRRKVDMVLIFPRLIAKWSIRKTGYTFTPLTGLEHVVIDKPTEKLTAAILKKSYQPSGLVKSIFYTGGTFYAAQKIILKAQEMAHESMQKTIQENKAIYENFISNDFRAHYNIKVPFKEGYISHNEALQSAWFYLEQLKQYRENLGKPLTVHDEVWQNADSILFQDVYAFLHRLGYLNEQAYQDYIKEHSTISAAQRALSLQLQQMIFNNQSETQDQPPSPYSKQKRDQVVNDVFKAKHMLLYQDTFLDELFLNISDTDLIELYQKPKFKEYVLWQDFQTDPFVKYIFEVLKKEHKSKKITQKHIKYILQQDFQDQYLFRLAKITGQKEDKTLEEKRQKVLQIIASKTAGS